MMEQSGHSPTLMGVRRTMPPTSHLSSRVSPGIRTELMCTRHHADAWKPVRPETSTSLVSLMTTVWLELYVAYPMIIPSGVVIGMGLLSPSVPSSSGTEIEMLSPAQ